MDIGSFLNTYEYIYIKMYIYCDITAQYGSKVIVVNGIVGFNVS